MPYTQKTLVIMAAGIGSRFQGGIKQLYRVGPAGECIMDYSVYDALQAGFNRIVFVIRKDIEDLFEDLIGKRIRSLCQKRGVEVMCAYQEKQNLPHGFTCPADRVKPWGTGHALLSCKGMLDGGIVVVNADDYYGKEAYLQMSQFLDTLGEESTGQYALAGFRLANTLSEYGGVTRGLCTVDDAGILREIRETRKIIKTANGAGVEKEGGVCHLEGDTPVSMNMWAFTPDVLDRLETNFTAFLAGGGLEDSTSEFLIPTEVGKMLEDSVQVRVIPTTCQWFGMTFLEEVPMVSQSLAQMTREGFYPSPLWG